MLKTIVNKNNYISIYLYNHSYEFEIKNVYRIFDFRSDMKFFYEENIDFDNSKIVISSELIDSEEGLLCKTALYIDRVQFFYLLVNENEIKIEKDDVKKFRKTLVKKSFYAVVSKYFGEKSEYGFLTGVRPNKILISAIKNNISREDINFILKNTYEVSDEKIKLLNDIYDKQEKYIFNSNINNIDKNNEYRKNFKQKYNLYIHIPFCPTKCSYCSFVSFIKYDQTIIDEYIDCLIFEIEKTINLAINNNLELNTIYFGGGTPSVLSVKNINDIFNVIKKYYCLENVAEISFEAGRPDTIDEEKLICLKNNHVNRISINPQTMNDKTLLKMSRAHSEQDIVNTYNLARKIDFKSINMDLIIGFDGESLDDVFNSVSKIVKLRPDNITVHTLSLKRGSLLINNSNNFSKDTEMLKKMYNLTKKLCLENGYNPYYMYRQKNTKGNLENIGYALDKKESIYNIVIIEEIETILGCGAGAISKIFNTDGKHERVQNYKDLKEYIKGFQKNIDDKCKNMMIRY